MSIADVHAEASWASWLPLCCMPMNSSDKKTGRKSSLNTISTTGRGESWPLGRSSDEELLMGQDEKPTHDAAVICDQPLHHPLPTPTPEMSFHQRTMGEKVARNNPVPKKRRFLSISSTSTAHKGHRPTISAPTHFRHISTGSPQFAFPEPRSKPKIKTHRPTISAPTHFRHVSTGSPFSEPIPTMPNLPTQAPNMPPARLRRRRSFRPLELSIYLPENKTSPLMAHFAKEDQLQSPAPVYDPERMEREPRNETVSPPETPEPKGKLSDSDSEASPPPIPPSRLSTLHRRSASTSDLTASDKSSSGSRPLEHQRSFSAMSFHFPRKPVAETTNSTPSPILEDDDIPPLIPPKARSRARAHTSPDVEAIRERVASAMIEVEQLQRQIDNVLERQSLYGISRPSTSHSAANTMPELEPMPSIPALPPAAPSFAERLNSEIERPRTAPIKSHVHTHRRARTMDNTPPRPHTPPMRKARRSEIPLPPPLPLVLRPPLRKKKSFSRVSTWLFPGAESGTDRPMDSVTNNPRPVTGKDGFYQCVSLADAHGRRHSDESLGTVTTWNSDDDRTVPSAWSPTSTAVTKGDELFVPRSATATAGGNGIVSPLVSVGVAV